MTRPSIAPLCWGQACSFAPAAKQCKACIEGESCAATVLHKLSEISETINVTDLAKRAQSYLDKRGVARTKVKINAATKQRFAESASCTFEVPSAVDGLAAKPKKLATAIAKLGIDMKADAEHGENSFPANFRPTYMSKIQELLNNRTFNRESVKEVIAADRELSSIALNNAASTVFQALIALNVVDQDGDF